MGWQKGRVYKAVELPAAGGCPTPSSLVPPATLYIVTVTEVAASTLYTVHCTLYTVYFTLYTVHFTLYTVHCTLYTVHCTL